MNTYGKKLSVWGKREAFPVTIPSFVFLCYNGAAGVKKEDENVHYLRCKNVLALCLGSEGIPQKAHYSGAEPGNYQTENERKAEEPAGDCKEGYL